jgi:hypothetical protein
MITNSPFGRVMQGLRENEERIRFLGIDSKRFQLVIFVFSGLFTAVAGILWTILQMSVFNTYMSLILSAEGLMMCLIGGMSSFFGPTIGAAIVVLVSTVASTYVREWQGLLGLIKFSIPNSPPIPQPEEMEIIRATYDAALLELDELLHGLVTTLEHRGFLKNTILIVCSDHGSIWENTISWIMNRTMSIGIRDHRSV